MLISWCFWSFGFFYLGVLGNFWGGGGGTIFGSDIHHAASLTHFEIALETLLEWSTRDPTTNNKNRSGEQPL
eukprot:5088036-Amphidinium_carterae.1